MIPRALFLNAWCAAMAIAPVACNPVDSLGDQWPDLPLSAGLVPHTVLTEVHTAQHSGIRERQRRAIRTGDEWEAFWVAFNGPVEPMPAPPAINFSERMVVVAAMGERPTGGYAIAIESVHAADGKLMVRVEERSPGADCATTQALTAPVTAVVIPRSTASVEFHDRAVTVSCG
jgi:hypothetical protein